MTYEVTITCAVQGPFADQDAKIAAIIGLDIDRIIAGCYLVDSGQAVIGRDITFSFRKEADALRAVKMLRGKKINGRKLSMDVMPQLRRKSAGRAAGRRV